MKTSRDVARVARVSQSTVSRYFSNPDLLSDKTRERVQKAVEELNYSPNLAARSLKLNKSHIIGMVISSYDSIFYNAIAKRLERILRHSNYRLIVTFSSEDPEAEAECFNSLVASRIDGIIFTPVSFDTSHIITLSQQYNFATLQLYRKVCDTINSITINDEYGAYLATHALLSHNHRNILLIDYKTSIPTYRDKGFIRALKEFNAPLSDEMIYYFNSEKDLYADLKAKIEETSPTAIIAVTGNTGFHVLRYLKEANLNVPDNISLVIYDDSPWAQINEISVISHPFDIIAAEIAAQILQLIESDSNIVTHNKIEPFFENRNSIKMLKN